MQCSGSTKAISKVIELCAASDCEEHYCKTFTVNNGWLRNFYDKTKCIHNDFTSFEDFLENYTWSETNVVYCAAKKEGIVLSEEEQT